MRLPARLTAAAAVSAGLLGTTAPVAANAATPTRPLAAQAASAPSGIAAKGAYLYDADKATELWGVATTTKRPIGSITKMMTAAVVLHAGNLGKVVTIKKSYVDHVRNNDASSAGLRAGDKVTVRQLLNAMMLPSGCDAAYALGDVYGPGQTKFVAKMNKEAAALKMDAEMLKRPVNVGFSGGEKKRNEMVQMGILDPAFAILDETDSGLDIDALRIVGDGINRIMRKADKAVLLITHYQRLLDYVKPDHVHVLADGRITRSGGPELAHELEAQGYGAVAA